MTSDSLSLKQYDNVADRVRQHRQASVEPIVIVEGPHDEIILRRHIEHTAIFPANGKNNVVSSARALIGWNIADFVCITDRDFDDPACMSDIEDVHFPYPSRDLEMMLIEMGVLAMVLQHVASRDKLERLGGAEALVDRLRESVVPVTRLRIANCINRWGLAFDEVDLASKIEQKTLNLKTQNYCSALVQASETDATASALIAAAEEKVADEAASRGKDIIVAASVALRKLAGSLPHAFGEDLLTSQVHSSCGLALSKSEWLRELKSKLDSKYWHTEEPSTTYRT